MRGAPTELGPLKRAWSAAVLLLAAWLPASARAQDAPAELGEPRAFAEAHGGVTSLVGIAAPIAGGSFTLRVGSRFQVGGAGRTMLGARTIVRRGTRVRLRFGWGGVVLGFTPSPDRRPGLLLRALVGSGSITTRDPSVGGLTDKDNGLVIEPGAVYGRALGRRLTLQGAASWRYARGFQVLGGIRSRNLWGPTGSIGISVGPF